MERDMLAEIEIVRNWISEFSMLVNEALLANSPETIANAKGKLKSYRERMINRLDAVEKDLINKGENDD